MSGGLAGLFLVSLLDAAVLSYDEQPPAPQVSVAPWLAPEGDTWGVDVRGTM